MGIAQDQVELNKVIALARDTGYVKNVVSYVKLAGDPLDVISEPSLQPTPLSNQPTQIYAPGETAQGVEAIEWKTPSNTDASYQAVPLNNSIDYQNEYPFDP